MDATVTNLHPTSAAVPEKLTWRFETPTPDDWQQLRGRLPPERRFLAGDWAAAWAENYLPYGRWRLPLRFLSVRGGDGALVGALPLVDLQFGPLKVHAAAGYFFPYRGVPLAGPGKLMEASAGQIAAALEKRRFTRPALRIGPTASDDPMTAALVIEFRRRGYLSSPVTCCQRR